MDENTDKKFIDDESQIYEIIKNHKIFTKKEAIIGEQLEKFKNKEEINLLLKVLNEHYNEENIENAIRSGFIEEITGLNNSNLFFEACNNGYKNLYKLLFDNIIEVIDNDKLEDCLCIIVKEEDIDFFERCLENQNLKQKIENNEIKIEMALYTGYNYDYIKSNDNKKKLAKLFFENDILYNSLKEGDVLEKFLLNSASTNDIETLKSFNIKKDGKESLIKKIKDKQMLYGTVIASINFPEYFKEVLKYDDLRLCKNKVDNMHVVTNCFINLLVPVSDIIKIEENGKEKIIKKNKKEIEQEKNIKDDMVKTILQYDDAKELICQDFLLLCKRPFSEYAIEYLINNDELLGKILENNNNAIEEAFIYSWANDEDPKVAKVLFDNEKTRRQIKSETIESCFKAACASNNTKKVNLLIDKIDPDIINKYFKLACEYKKLETVQLLATKIDDETKKRLFSDKFFVKKNKLSEQDLRLSSILIKSINDKEQKQASEQDYKKFKNNIEDLIDDLIEKKRINDNIKDSIKNLKKNDAWKKNEMSNFNKIFLTLDKIEQNLPQLQV